MRFPSEVAVSQGYSAVMWRYSWEEFPWAQAPEQPGAQLAQCDEDGDG